MIREHISIPDDMHTRLTKACQEYGFAKAKLLRMGLQLVLDDIEARYGPPAAKSEPAAGEPAKVAPTLHTPARVDPGAPPYANPYSITPIRRGDVVWYQLDAVLKSLAVDQEELLAEIDSEDDTLNYLGETWIDEKGLNEARALCRDPGLGDKVVAWCEFHAHKLLSPTTAP